MKLIMAVSKDGYMARSKYDDMSWLGSTDKAVFRMLTLTGRDPCFVSLKSSKCMPKILPGRELFMLSRVNYHNGEMSLHQAQGGWPNAWLLGGPSLARVALEAGYVDEVHLCQSDRMAFPDPMDPEAVPDTVTPYVSNHSQWHMTASTKTNDVTVECWKHQDV